MTVHLVGSGAISLQLVFMIGLKWTFPYPSFNMAIKKLFLL